MKPKEPLTSAMVITAACLLWAAGAPVAANAQISGGSPRVTLPFDLVDTLDGPKFKIRVPANWNGTLLVYQGAKVGAPPPEPLLAPPALPGPDAPLEDTLLSRGYALAASEIASSDWQTKASVQDHFALTTYFRGRIGDPKRVILWGTSNGGLDKRRRRNCAPLPAIHPGTDAKLRTEGTVEIRDVARIRNRGQCRVLYRALPPVGSPLRAGAREGTLAEFQAAVVE